MTVTSITDRLHDALAHADVRVDEIPPPVPGWPCRWCQEIAAVCSVTVYWTPREDVLSDGMAECCRDCAPERIRRALDDSVPAARVAVEIVGGGS